MRNLKLLTILMTIGLSLFAVAEAEAQLLNPCCRPVPVCCGPVIVRRPIIRNAASELRMALNYHLNYRFYRGIIYGSPEITHHDSTATPSPAEAHSAEKPYHEKSAERCDSVLQPVQPQDAPSPDPEPQQPQAAPTPDPAAESADQPQEQPADDKDAFQIEQPTTATIMLTVPKNSIVIINGKPTSSTGTTRTFISRNLDPSARYRYNVEVSWNVGASQYKITEVIALVPGQTIAKSFANPYLPTVVKK